MSKPNGSTCVSIYLLPEDREQFKQLRGRINKKLIANGERKLTKYETWRLILKTATKYYEMGGDNADTIDS